MTKAEPVGDDQVLVEAAVGGRTESGEARMRADRCTIELDLHTPGPDDPVVDAAVRRSVGAIIAVLTVRTDAAQQP